MTELIGFADESFVEHPTDGFYIVAVGTPVPQRKQERARAMCLTQLVVELHRAGVHQLVMEARETELNHRDVQTVAGARWRLPQGSSFRIDHEFGIVEPALWLPDVVAGAVRVAHLGNPVRRRVLDERIREISVTVL